MIRRLCGLEVIWPVWPIRANTVSSSVERMLEGARQHERDRSERSSEVSPLPSIKPVLAFAVWMMCAFIIFARPFHNTYESMITETGHVWGPDGRLITHRIATNYWIDYPPRLRLLAWHSRFSPWYAIGAMFVGAAIGFLRRKRMHVLAFLGALGVPIVVQLVAKPLVHRHTLSEQGVVTDTFPSLHVAVFAALATAIVLVARRGLVRLVLAVGLTVATALYTYYTALAGFHFLSDCIGSMLLAPAVVAMFVGLVELVARRITSSAEADIGRALASTEERPTDRVAQKRQRQTPRAGDSRSD